MGQSNKDHQLDNDSNGFQQQPTALQLDALFLSLSSARSLQYVLNMYAHIHYTYVANKFFYLKIW